MKGIAVLACILVGAMSGALVEGQYGAAAFQNGFRGYGNGDYDGEPANYEFQYDVEAGEYGVKFGHQEARQGDVAQGRYYVLLPDGRTQVVEYVADQDGYQPRIKYDGGYSSGPSPAGY